MAGQSLTEIRALLAAAGLTPRHQYGQNFLIDLNLLRKLPAAAELNPADVVLEVGPGTGSLTELLLNSGARVVAVEVDRGFQAVLRARLREAARFTLVAGDVLAGKHTVNPGVLAALRDQPAARPGAYKLVANLPYQVATPLLMELLHAQPRFARLVCTIQREVGERLLAQPETAAYGPVSVITQSLATSETLAVLPPSVFWPRPKVESVMLRITPLPAECVDVPDIAGFVGFVRSAFQQRRKMLRRILRDWPRPIAAEAFEQAGISGDARPEALSPAEWRRFFAAARPPDRC